MTPYQDRWESEDGSVVLYLGDCLDILPTLEPGSVPAIVTDPPYGIGEHGGACRTRGRPGYAKHECLGWDNEPPPPEAFVAMLSASTDQIIWGGNYFADRLPPTQGWLYWRKLMGGDFADGELAWTSLGRALREFTKCPKGMDKQHPAEKPVELMEWCIAFLPDGCDTILDPYMGSGTTLVAALRMGRRAIGIEREPRYFAIARKRIEAELGRFPLFTEPEAIQTELFQP